MYGYFKRQTSEISHEMIWIWLRNEKLKWETESLLTAAQNNAIRTNYVKAKIDKTPQNSKCRLCGDRCETINLIISECSKLAQKQYKLRNNWMGKVIHWELCKKLEFDHTNKWYMHNPESVLENKTHKLLRNFEMQTDHLISARQPDTIIINKKNENLQNCGLWRPSDSSYNWYAWNGPKRLGKWIESTAWGRLIYREETWGDLITRNQLKDHQLTLVWKTRKE